MATIPPSVPPAGGATNAQLAGIQATIPMPTGGVLTDGTSASFNPFLNLATVGGQAAPSYTINTPTVDGAGTPITAATPNTAAAATGGGGTAAPTFGAQPTPPGVPAVTPSAVNVTANAPANAPAAAAAPIAATAPVAVDEVAAAARSKAAAAKMPTKATATGFGRTDKDAVQKVSVDGAKFSFPSFNSTAKQTDAPQVTWGAGWKQVDAGNGFYYMQHANGTKAVPATEYRLAATPLDKVQTIKVANGWGKKFPDGTVVVFDKDKGAYRIAPDGSKSKLPFGKQEIGGIKVRIFEAAVVRTLEANGAVRVFDSRGTTSLGTTRGHAAAAAGGGAAQLGSVVQAGGANGSSKADLIAKIQEMTGLTRAMIGQVQAGTVDPTQLAAIQTKLSALPAGLQQAIAAGGAMPAAGTGTLVAGGGAAGTTTATPTAGVNANETVKQLAAGAKAKLTGAVPQDLVGMQARFGQLSETMQAAVATAFGSDQGPKAFEADAQIAFSATGEATVVEGARVFTAKQVQVRGAGPGEDLVMTMRPVRQPGTPGKMTTGGATGVAISTPTVGSGTGSVAALGSDHGAAGGVGASGNAAAPIGVAGGGATSSMARIKLFPAGGSLTSPALAGIEGSFTWKTLPTAARTAIQSWLTSNPSSSAGAALASRTGVGWNFDPDAAIVIGGGEATFLNGLGIAKPTTVAAATGGGAAVTGGGAPAATGGAPAPAAARPATGTGPTTTPVGHDATKPPVTGGGGTGATPPATAPPTPAIGGGGMAGMDMTGMAGMAGH